MFIMARPLIPDDLWSLIEPHLPHERPVPYGRKPVPNRKALTGIMFVLKTGIPWEYLPQEMGCGSGMTCWRRLRDWQQAGVWDRILRLLQDTLGKQGRIDWSRAALDSASVRAKGGGRRTGRNPTDRGKLGSKHHIVVDRNGIPLAKPTLSAANEHDSNYFGPVLDSIRPIRRPRGRPRRRPAKLHADKAYDYKRCRVDCSLRGIKARIARRGIESSTRLGRFRWVVERTISWLHNFRRLTVRYERRDDIHQALLTLGTIMICWNFLRSAFC
jgi:transposase